MSRDNSPVSETCPSIDKVISIMEDIRDANSSLREWGNELYYELDEAKSTIRDLEREIDDLKAEVRALEEELSNERS